MEKHSILDPGKVFTFASSLLPRPRPAMTWSNFLDRLEPSASASPVYTSCGAKTSHMNCASLHLEIATEV